MGRARIGQIRDHRGRAAEGAIDENIDHSLIARIDLNVESNVLTIERCLVGDRVLSHARQSFGGEKEADGQVIAGILVDDGKAASCGTGEAV